MTRSFSSALLALLVGWPTLGAAETPLVRNGLFREGDAAPAGWTLTGGAGRWVDRDVLEVTGDGRGSNAWRSSDIAFQPGGLYRFAMRARRPGGSGLVISGPPFANHDYGALAPDWVWYSHVFRVPEGPVEKHVRVGQWEAKGVVQFDAVRVTPVVPVHRAAAGVLLGEGESLHGGRYRFATSFDTEGGNDHRPLHAARAVFNSNRWCFGDGSEVVYRFGVPGHPFRTAEARVHVNYHTAGACAAEVSRDGRSWRSLASRKGVGDLAASVPAELFPADVLYLRLRPEGPGNNFQVNRIEFEGAVEGPPTDADGRTLYADVDGPAGVVASLALVDGPGPSPARLRIAVRGPRAGETVRVRAAVRPPGGGELAATPQAAPASGAPGTGVDVPLPLAGPGRHEVTLTVEPPGSPAVRLTVPVTVPEFYRADYGEGLPAPPDGPAVWWCDAGWKVPRTRALPAAAGEAVRLAACRDDREAVQVVVRPDRPLAGLTASAGPLTGPGGAVIPAGEVQVLRVHYHRVEHPTDATGVRDWWPDALPPLDRPIDVAAGDNQPLWVLVHVPADARAGDYTGRLSLKAVGWSAEVPLRLHVWDFALPERNHLATAFGFDPGTVFRYHGVTAEADKRKLLDLYFQSFAEHRISPYNPTPLDPIRVRFLPDAVPPRAEVDFTAFDREMARALSAYRFTHFSLPIQGLGGGTFHHRVDPGIGSFGADTPQYQAMFASQVKQIEDHLRQKGWLDSAYVYWFDEPDPKDYAFVRRGMERIRKYAPGIPRMLTEEPGEALAGCVDVWCPISNNFDPAQAAAGRKRGERVWWYVCTGPRAPYCTLFIDHPATELRVWHWQAWQRHVTGSLVWATTWWTSPTAFPDRPQDPYLDPMAYVAGYGVPKGTKQFWGNGDGRFLYPPEDAAVPGLKGPDPVLKPPVSSIRWEMLREGIEDYEYLHLLRERLNARRASLPAGEVHALEDLLRVPEAITKDMTTFTKDPRPILDRRARVAEAIERLGR